MPINKSTSAGLKKDLSIFIKVLPLDKSIALVFKPVPVHLYLNFRYFNDKPITGSTDRTVFAYKLVGDTKVTTIENAGTVTPSTGTVVLNNFTPDDTTAIRLTITPDSLDVAPKREEILSVDGARMSVTAEIDTISTAGSSGSIDYTTTSRFRT